MATRPFLVPLSAALLAALSGASGSGFLIADAAAQVARRPDDEDEADVPLVLAVANAPASDLLATHRSHRSHSSHRSHVSGSGGGGYGGGGDYASPDPPTPTPTYVPPPPPPKPAEVSFVVYPGGRIFIDGILMGTDATGTLSLKPEGHNVRVENRFLGEHTRTIYLTDGQTGVVTIEW